MSTELEVLDLAILRLETLDWRVQAYVDKHMIDVAIQEIVDPLKRLAQSRQHAQVFIDAIGVEKMGHMKIGIVINEILTRDGKPLNIMLENGWSEFWNEPVNVSALHWAVGGINYFSKGHWIRGFPGYHLMFSMERWGFVDRFMLRLINDTNTWLEENKFR